MALKPFDKVLFNPDQAQEMREDCSKWEAAIKRAYDRDDQASARLNIQETQERLRRVKKQLAEEVADGDLTPAQRDQLATRERELRGQITHGMLDEETMRKCPSDAPNRHIQWERANMGRIMEWKNIRQQLEPDNNEAQNLEPFRPRGAQGYGYRSDTAIAGTMSNSDLPADKYAQAFGKGKKTLTPEQRAQIGKRLAESRAKKKAQATA